MKANLGTKHTCADCGAKFYDLNKQDPACPKCGGGPLPAPEPPKGRSSRKPARKMPPPKSIDDDDDDDDEFEGDDIDLGDDDIGDDDMGDDDIDLGDD